MSQRDAIERIDKFIKQLDDHDIILEPQKLGKGYGYYQKTKGIFGYKDQYVGSFAEMLSRHLASYQQAKTSTDTWLRTYTIDNALYWINQAYAWNIVKPSDGIFGKYDDALDRIKMLEKELKEKEDELTTVSNSLQDSEVERRSLSHQLKDISQNTMPLVEYERISNELLKTRQELEDLKRGGKPA